MDETEVTPKSVKTRLLSATPRHASRVYQRIQEAIRFQLQSPLPSERKSTWLPRLRSPQAPQRTRFNAAPPTGDAKYTQAGAASRELLGRDPSLKAVWTRIRAGELSPRWVVARSLSGYATASAEALRTPYRVSGASGMCLPGVTDYGGSPNA